VLRGIPGRWGRADVVAAELGGRAVAS
jgi:hypothetical protein